MTSIVMMFERRPLLALIILLSACLPGCEESISGFPQVTIEPTLSSIQQNIFARSCTTVSCHSTLSQRGGLILEKNAFKNLVGVPADNSSAGAKGLLRVNPGKPDSSFLIIKLTGPGPDEGDRMPDNNNSLSQKEIDVIRTWIANGALDN